MYVHVYVSVYVVGRAGAGRTRGGRRITWAAVVAIFYPFSQFCEINTSLSSNAWQQYLGQQYPPPLLSITSTITMCVYYYYYY